MAQLCLPRRHRKADRVDPLEVGEHEDVQQFGAGAEDVYEEPADPRARLDLFWELQARTFADS